MNSFDLIWRLIEMLLAEKSNQKETKDNERD